MAALGGRWWFAALLCACSSAPPPQPDEAEIPQPLISAPSEQRRYALILPEHGLSAAPRPDAMVIAPRWGGERGRGEALGLFRLVRHMGEHDGWVALETIPRGEEEPVGSCYETMSALSALRLRLYAPREALATVTAQRIRQQHPDGTAVELAAGVALIADAQDETRWSIAAQDLVAPVRIPRSQLATSFAAQPLDPPTPPPEDAPKPRTLAADAFSQKRVTLQGQPLTRAPAGKNMVRAADILYGPQQEDGAWLGTLIQPCARLTVRVEEAGLAEPLAGLLGIGGISGGRADRRARKLTAGTKLYWADGRPAGEVVHDTSLSSVSVSPDKLTECFTIHPQLPAAVCVKRDE